MTEARIAQKAPYPVDVKVGRKVFWCACGRSARQPFCDGSHEGTDFTPMPYQPEKDGKLFFCGCKRTGSAPLCDGTHNSL
ncbi:MAG: CDGSH iron-sulfur domain-containing protein [Pseudomonadales bacterium]